MCRKIMERIKPIVPTNMRVKWYNFARVAIEYDRPVTYTWNETVKVGWFKKELRPKPHDSTEMEHIFIDTHYSILSVDVSSEDPCMDEVAKKVAVEISHYFKTSLYIAKYSDELPHGLKCQYCSQYTHDTEKCEHCGGVPI
jgi:hypothetical protein